MQHSKNFGLIEMTCQKYFDFGLFIMLPVLRIRDDSRIFWPLHDQGYLDAMVGCFQRFVPELVNVYGYRPVATIDGIRYPIQNKKRIQKPREEMKVEKKRVLSAKILY